MVLVVVGDMVMVLLRRKRIPAIFIPSGGEDDEDDDVDTNGFDSSLLLPISRRVSDEYARSKVRNRDLTPDATTT